jgi:hypothetical protein
MRAGGIFLLTTVTHATSWPSDEIIMLLLGNSFPDEIPVESVSDLQLRALCVEDHQQTLRMLSLVLAPSGGWLLRHRKPAPGILQVVFEFERNAAIDIYVMLVALGLELTRNSHLLLTSYCQRSAGLSPGDTIQVASCELEIRELADEASSPEPLFGVAGNA